MNYKIKLKMALKIWVIIYPSITLFLAVFGPLLSELPLYVRTFILTACLVPFIVFIGLPTLEKILHLFAANKASKPQMKR